MAIEIAFFLIYFVNAIAESFIKSFLPVFQHIDLFKMKDFLQFLIDSSFVSTHRGVLLFNLIQLFNILGGAKQEFDSPMPYSKFAAKSISKGDKAMVPSKLGMLIIYLPAFFTSIGYMYFLPQFQYETHVTLAGLMCLAHFAKRNLEVLFVHSYSGSTELSAARLIAFFYALVTFMICFVSSTETGEVEAKISQVLFVTGMAGNLYHHYLLASLRSKTVGSQKSYVAPKGGLFEYVAAPHYLFELVTWLGIAVASGHITAYLNLISMTGYLGARSFNQNNWNKTKFDKSEWPDSRKNLVPFIY